MEANETDEVIYSYNSNMLGVNMTAYDLDDFFRRPVQIGSGKWTIGSNYIQLINPWDAYTLDPTVRSKLRNYAYLRANIVVDISFSCTAYHYGRGIISYIPEYTSNNSYLTWAPDIAADANMRPLFISYLSSMNESVSFALRENRTIQFTFPYIAPKGAIRLYDTTSLASTSSYPDVVGMGMMAIATIGTLQGTGTAVQGVSYYIYAHLENVQLGVSTGSQVQIVTESKDERKSGPMERACSSMAEVTNALSIVPKIAPYAQASSYVLKGLGNMAAWFGWSVPNVLDEPRFFKNRAFGSACQVVGHSTTERLTLDPLQEVSIDPSVGGCEEDELTIAGFANRYAYLDTIIWSASDPVGKLVFTAEVTPFHSCAYTKAGVNYIQMTPMMMATIPFRYWRGDITFKIEIAKNNFHRGKLAAFWEPNTNETVPATYNRLNKQSFVIFDLEDSDVFEFTVGYAQPWPWLNSISNTAQWQSQLLESGTHSVPVYNQRYVNGYLGVTIINTLQAPDAPSLELYVYAKCDNLEVNFPDDTIMKSLDRQYITESRSIDESKKFKLSEGLNHDGYSQYYFGEQPLSFRSLMKRFATIYYVGITSSSVGNYGFTLTLENYPSEGMGFGTPPSTQRYYIFDYLRYSFLCVKGGTRFRVHFGSPSDIYTNFCQRYVVSLSTVTNGTASPALAYTNNGDVLALRASNVYMPSVNSGIEYEIPFYSPNLYCRSCSTTYDGESTSGQYIGTRTRNHTVTGWLATTSATTNLTAIVDMSTAEDFNMFRWVGVSRFSYV